MRLLHSTAVITAAMLAASTTVTTVDAAAGLPLVRDSMIFQPLSCNSNLDSADCSATSLESIIHDASSNMNNSTTTTEILIPCGTCATLTTTDGSTLNLSTSTLNIEGKLHVPSSAQATLRTRGIFIQGELQIDPPTASAEGLRVQLVGTDDVVFVPNDENVEKCAVGGCNEGSKPVVVSRNIHILHMMQHLDTLFKSAS